MIEIRLKDYYKNTWSILLPHEINNEFFWGIKKGIELGMLKEYNINIFYSDFGLIEIPVEKLDKLYNDYVVLENNIDDIITIVPLPDKIGGFDGYYKKGFVNYNPQKLEELEKWINERKKGIYLPFEEEKLNITINEPKEFTKKDMLLIISLIKKKIIEAKKNNLPICFSGD